MNHTSTPSAAEQIADDVEKLILEKSAKIKAAILSSNGAYGLTLETEIDGLKVISAVARRVLIREFGRA